MGGLVGGNLGPEPRVDLVAAEPAPPYRSQKREQGQGLSLACGAAARSTVPEDRWAAENLELQHPTPLPEGETGEPWLQLI